MCVLGLSIFLHSTKLSFRVLRKPTDRSHMLLGPCRGSLCGLGSQLGATGRAGLIWLEVKLVFQNVICLVEVPNS